MKALRDECDLLRYALRGVCDTNLHIRVNLEPSMLSGGDERLWDAVQAIVEHYSASVAHEIERRLGERHELLKELDEARAHIRYLEGHASSRGLSFQPYGLRPQFK